MAYGEALDLVEGLSDLELAVTLHQAAECGATPGMIWALLREAGARLERIVTS